MSRLTNRLKKLESNTGDQVFKSLTLEGLYGQEPKYTMEKSSDVKGLKGFYDDIKEKSNG